ncbi:MAG TPA: PDZ domain-containing protein [Gemmatimonadaceae bacterium]|nr:PDZ domain-containing protein [Gemmatimonadaceae bacterium]
MFRSFAGRAALLVTLGAALPAGAQRAPTDVAQSAPLTGVRYEVTADRAGLGQRQLHVVTTFTVAGTAPVLLSLPAWTPGAYDIANFARSVSDFGATQGADSLRWDKADYDTWRLWPRRAGQVSVSFDVVADTLDNAMSWSRPDFVLFNGTNVFLYPEGRPADFASTVVIKTEPDFLIATGMPRAPEARTYRAANYHELVDMPFFVGQFDLDSAVVSGKTVRFATYPRGVFAGEARTTAWDQIKRSIPPQVLVFGDVPWDTYTVMHITDSTAQGMSGLEHANSHVDITVPRGIGSEFQPRLLAHEIFHAWNVKRLRPADLVPYRYDRPQQTGWLWVSEGITDYYADLSLVRGGVVDANGFYALTTEKIGEIANAPPFALEDASLNAWISVRDGTDALYYPKGSLAGFLLDIMIRDASDNRRSLDDVMRELYRTTYGQGGRGFTAAQWWGAVRRASNGKSYDEFNRRYVDGRDPYPWDDALKLVGLRLQPDSVPRIGVSLRPEPDGNGARVLELVPGSPALGAGIRVGDVIVTVNERPAMDVFFAGGFRAMYGNRPAGTPIPVVIRRDGASVTIQVPLRFGLSEPRVNEDPAASPRAVRLRNGLLRGTTDK